MKQKKSQGLPISAIIIAALAMVVKVVLLAIFTGSIKTTAENIGSCTTKGGLCADKLKLGDKSGDKCGGDYPIPIFVSGECKDTKPKNLCCLKALSEEKK